MPAAPEAVSAAAEAAFDTEYRSRPGRPVCVVIAALDEEGSVGEVVRSVPPEAAGFATEIIVVDDGSTDGTAVEARAAGALVCRFDTNLGQGAALRTAYRLATRRGAAVIATMDADGQFDAGELAAVVEPVASGRADMVQGSRRLGRNHADDLVRGAGVVFFGGLISVLARTRITDPSNGFRAFRPEVPANVPLRQAQYQTAELLMGALALGYRVVEVPVTVHPRTAGLSKKGTNLTYGYRFGRVILTTWWSVGRSGRGRPRR